MLVMCKAFSLENVAPRISAKCSLTAKFSFLWAGTRGQFHRPLACDVVVSSRSQGKTMTHDNASPQYLWIQPIRLGDTCFGLRCECRSNFDWLDPFFTFNRCQVTSTVKAVWISVNASALNNSLAPVKARPCSFRQMRKLE